MTLDDSLDRNVNGTVLNAKSLLPQLCTNPTKKGASIIIKIIGASQTKNKYGGWGDNLKKLKHKGWL